MAKVKASLTLCALLLIGCGGGTSPTSALRPVPFPSPTPSPIPLVVFIGDSVTQIWSLPGPHGGNQLPFPGAINKGVGGNTSDDINNRFDADVIALHPVVVLIQAGANDLGQSFTPSHSAANFSAMTLRAQTAGIKVIICTMEPIDPAKTPVATVRAFNDAVRSTGASLNAGLADYYSVLSGADGSPLPGVLYDGVHPDDQGFALMSPVAVAAIKAQTVTLK